MTHDANRRAARIRLIWNLTLVGGLTLTSAVAVAAQDKPAQEKPAPPKVVSSDPRVGLKAGVKDAGQVARNIELIGHLDKPEPFTDPTGSLNFANSDLAFKGHQLFLGNFHGLNFYNIEDPRKPKLTVSMPCPGGQGDVSVFRNLLFMSVEQTRGRLDCGTQGVSEVASPDRFRGVRIFDITDPSKPQQIAAVQTCRGSHTHTLLVDPKDKENVYIYGSGTGGGAIRRKSSPVVRARIRKRILTRRCSASTSFRCRWRPRRRPRSSAVPAFSRIRRRGRSAGCGRAAITATGTQRTSVTNQCHDITVMPSVGLAAGACSGNGILLDITDPVHPVRLDAVTDKSFAYWHSATFNNDGTKVIFTDEWGGGTSPRCRDTDLLTWGADAVFDISKDRKLAVRRLLQDAGAADGARRTASRTTDRSFRCPGRDIMVQAWYQGGVSVFDFTDSTKPVEIAYFDRGPIDGAKLITAGYWSTYWYNGYIYGSEIGRGLDIFRLLPSDFLSQSEIGRRRIDSPREFNAQQQPGLTWPASFVVAKAYLDQLTRSKLLPQGRANRAPDGDGSGREGACRARPRVGRSAARKTHDGACRRNGERDRARRGPRAGLDRGDQGARGHAELRFSRRRGNIANGIGLSRGQRHEQRSERFARSLGCVCCRAR